MKFGRLPVAEAEGAILAHSVAAPLFKKGRKLSAADILALKAGSVAEVIAVRLEDGDVPEDVAARRLAEAARGAHVELSAAFTGRANLYASAHGLALIDPGRVNQINAIDESLTIATIAPFDLVEPRQMLATIKVIPFATPESVVKKAEEIALSVSWSAAADHPRLHASASKKDVDGPPPRTMTSKECIGSVVSVAPFKPKRIALISTTVAGMKASLLDKNATVMAARASALGSAVIGEARCLHEESDIARTVREAAKERPDIILIFGASATTDRCDAVPAGIVAAGGEIEHFGMPVDPGNLLLMARLRAVPVVGLPGCARSPKINGFDFVLQRLCADVPVTSRDIMQMGVGGLLKEIPTRPQPRDRAPANAKRAPKVAAIVLGAGKSSRMGANKLLMPIKGRPMIVRTVDAVLMSSARPVIVVSGNAAAEVERALKGREVTFVRNPHYAEGLSTSLRAGLAALPDDSDGVLVCLGDMPAVSAAAMAKLIAALNPAEGRGIVVPTYQGKRGNPVLFARDYFGEAAAARGDGGAKHVIAEHEDVVCEVEMDDASVLADADTPAAFAALEAQIKA